MVLELVVSLMLRGDIARSEALEPRRPVCREENEGKMWPASANDNWREALELAREGRLEICSRGPWRFRWSSPTVHIRELREKAFRKANAGARGGT